LADLLARLPEGAWWDAFSKFDGVERPDQPVPRSGEGLLLILLKNLLGKEALRFRVDTPKKKTSPVLFVHIILRPLILAA
jgi:hypothetical protein